MEGTTGLNLLNVRETARRLGVHENTVRNWAREGVLRDARLPGTRFLKFEEHEVERLRLLRGEVVATMEPDRRRLIGPELVDATQLGTWATTRRAQDLFPELIRRLLAATPGTINVSVRTGDGIALPGWDGRAEASGAPFLPNGSLAFEFGVGQRPEAKATEDYDKRCRDPLGLDPSQTVFVFITPRRWPRAGSWAAERQGENIFAGVRVLDGDDLEGWLNATPTVHYWLSEQLGSQPQEVQTLELWWQRLREATDPELPRSLVLAGRKQQQAELKRRLTDSPSVITIFAPWSMDARAFLAEVIETMASESSQSAQHALIVKSSAIWDRISRGGRAMTLIPTFDDPDVRPALEHGNHVVLLADTTHAVTGDAIVLDRLARDEAGEAFRAAGVPWQRADGLGALARRSLPALFRQLARDPRRARPSWAQLPIAHTVAPLVLAGEWTTAAPDLDAVSRIANIDWPALENDLISWANTDDPPLIQSGTDWQLAAPEDALLLLRRFWTPTALSRWQEIAVEVLSEADPSLELSREDRPLAAIRGVSRRYSGVLRRGIAQGIALLGLLEDEQLTDGHSAADHTRMVVAELLNRAKEDRSGSTWQSMADILPWLAEAAPQHFLDCVHDDLDGPSPVLITMFQDQDEAAWQHHSPHTSLLWAIERLCWSPDYLFEGTAALARLHLIDPGGRGANRPLASLETVLVGWVRHTSASLDQKLAAIDSICHRWPDVGWRLLERLLPTIHMTAFPPSTPRFRDWMPTGSRVAGSDWVVYVVRVARLITELADGNVSRWVSLIARLRDFPPEVRAFAFERLEAIAQTQQLSSDERISLWERAHEEASLHERHHTADWALPPDAIARLKRLADSLEPTTDVQRHAYLFGWHPDLPDIDFDDFKVYQEKLGELRREALQETLQSGGIEALERLTLRTPVPEQLGVALGQVVNTDNLAPTLLSWLDSSKDPLREASRGWARVTLHQEGPERLERYLFSDSLIEYAARRRALVLQMPPIGAFWDALAQIDPDLLDVYWREGLPLGATGPDANRAARALVTHGRPWIAVDLLVLALHGKTEDSGVDLALIESVLESAAGHRPEGHITGSLGYHIGVLLDQLERQGVSAEKLVQFEFIFFRLLEHRRSPRSLYRTLSSDPHFFVELVKHAYRARNETSRNLNEQEQGLAQQAWWVLRHWNTAPGQRDDGTLDARLLRVWVQEARLALSECDREDIGDEIIGQALSAAPSGKDGIWPPEAVRDLIEGLGSRLIIDGMHIGLLNRRGVTTRSSYEGGDHERKLASQYRQWSQTLAGQWPRSARLLRDVSQSYERDAQREDQRAERLADTD